MWAWVDMSLPVLLGEVMKATRLTSVRHRFKVKARLWREEVSERVFIGLCPEPDLCAQIQALVGHECLCRRLGIAETHLRPF